MTLQRDFAGWKLSIGILATRRGWPRSFAVLLGAAALAFAGSQAGCNDSGSPTAPPLPPSPAPLERVVVSATYVLLIVPNNAERQYPRAAEILVDDRLLWSGAVEPPRVCCSSYYGYDGTSISYNIVARSEGNLSLGSHRLSFRVTDQARSPTGYRISGWVDVVWNTVQNGVRGGSSGSLRVASWQDAQARLRTGESWSLDFNVSLN